MDIYNEYDKLVAKAIQGICEITKDEPQIILSNLKDLDDHKLFVFNIAHISSGLTHKPFKIRTSLINFIKLKLMYPHCNFKLDFSKDLAVDSVGFVNLMYNIQPEVGFIGLDDIYNEYYKPRKKEK